MSVFYIIQTLFFVCFGIFLVWAFINNEKLLRVEDARREKRTKKRIAKKVQLISAEKAPVTLILKSESLIETEEPLHVA